MEQKPIFVITHTRSCSTAFARIFMTRRDLLTCFHEPFGDPFYFGPEKISRAWTRWPADKIAKSGKADCTYDDVLQSIAEVSKESKRAFVKDMSYHIIPPSHSPDAVAPSLQHYFKSSGLPNPTLLPTSTLNSFQFIFLIRNPSASIPSLWRCFIPPISDKTDEHFLDQTELGYRELRILFDYLYPPSTRPFPATPRIDTTSGPLIIDADDLLSHPESSVKSVCSRIGLSYSPSMLSWPTFEDLAYAESLFAKYAGYHEDALNSTGLHARKTRPVAKMRQEEDKDWVATFGGEAAQVVRNAVDLCKDDYEYLRLFRVRPDIEDENRAPDGVEH